MILNRADLFRIIREERKILNEGCGCGCNGAPGGCGGEMSDIRSIDGTTPPVIDDFVEYDEGYADDLQGYTQDELSLPHTTDREFLTREEALKAVVAIAMSTSCPVTSEALLNTVDSLM